MRDFKVGYKIILKEDTILDYNLKLIKPTKTDLTKIDVPFGQLDNETKIRLIEAYLNGEDVEYRSYSWWCEKQKERDLEFVNETVYRLKPEEVSIREQIQNKVLKLKQISNNTNNVFVIYIGRETKKKLLNEISFALRDITSDSLFIDGNEVIEVDKDNYLDVQVFSGL